MEQVRNQAKSPIVQRAWQKHAVQIHRWVYGLDSGLNKNLVEMIHGLDDLEPMFRIQSDLSPLLIG